MEPGILVNGQRTRNMAKGHSYIQMVLNTKVQCLTVFMWSFIVALEGKNIHMIHTNKFIQCQNRGNESEALAEGD